MLAITDASAGADPLGYVISVKDLVTNDVVTVRSIPNQMVLSVITTPRSTPRYRSCSRTLARFLIRPADE